MDSLGLAFLKGAEDVAVVQGTVAMAEVRRREDRPAHVRAGGGDGRGRSSPFAGACCAQERDLHKTLSNTVVYLAPPRAWC